MEEPQEPQEPKPITQSKTAWGAVAMLVSLALQQLHVPTPVDDIEKVISQGADALQVLSGVGGFILVIYGRYKAARAIK